MDDLLIGQLSHDFRFFICKYAYRLDSGIQHGSKFPCGFLRHIPPALGDKYETGVIRQQGIGGFYIRNAEETAE